MSEGAHTNGRLSSGDAVRTALDLVQQLAGRQPESVSGVNRCDEGGWTVAVDVVELSRIPPSTDVLATFEVTLDDGGELVEMARARRWCRNQAQED